MKSVTRALCLAAACAIATGAWAQTTTPISDKPAGATSKSITVTGCLREASGEPGLFVLASIDSEASGKVGATTAMSKETPVAKGHNMYRLAGMPSDDLKVHVGHKIQISGTPSKTDKPADTSVTTDKTMGSAKTITSAEAKSAIALSVISLKHISDTCSSAEAK